MKWEAGRPQAHEPHIPLEGATGGLMGGGDPLSRHHSPCPTNNTVLRVHSRDNSQACTLQGAETRPVLEVSLLGPPHTTGRNRDGTCGEMRWSMPGSATAPLGGALGVQSQGDMRAEPSRQVQ